MFWIFYAIPTILLNIPHIQRKVANKATHELSMRLGVPVRIEKVNIQWFNRLVLDGIYLEDKQGEVLFEANHIAAGFQVLPLLKGKFVFTTARIFGFNLNLSKETPDDPLNLQFVIDAFASRDSLKESQDIDLRFNSILIRRGDFSYHVKSEDQTPGKFNPNHVDIRNLSANISLKAFNNDSLNANIKRLSLIETSGVNLNRLSMNIVGNRDSAYIQNFEIRLPRTNFKITQARIDFTPVDSLSKLADDAPIVLNIGFSQICPQDLSAFVPAFTNFQDTIEISAEASGYINDIDLKRVTMSYSDKMLFNGKMNLKGITNPEETYMFGEVSRLFITNEGVASLYNNFNAVPQDLPEQVKRLGNINFTGEISGFFDNLVAYGKFNTAIGSVQTDILFGSNKEKNIAAYLKGSIKTSELKIVQLFDEENPYGIAQIDIHIDAQRPVDGKFSGNIKGIISEFDFKNYRYQNINLSGFFNTNSFNGKVEIDDPNGFLYAEGMVRNQGKNSIFDFTADLRHFRPQQLNLTDKYDSPDISLSVNANFTGNNIDNVEGTLSIDSLTFQTVQDRFFLNYMKIEAANRTDDKRLTISSDIINGEITGIYSFTTFVPNILHTLSTYIPALIYTRGKPDNTQENNFSLLLTIENTETLSSTFKLPVTLLGRSRISGDYNNRFNRFRLEAWLPSFKVNHQFFENGYVSVQNPSESAELQVRAINYNKKGLRNYIDLKADAHDNTLNTLISWANNKERLFKADISSTTTFIQDIDEKGKKDLFTEINLHRSPLIINDTTWYIGDASVIINNGRIAIDEFEISNEEQYARINGAVSQNPADTLLLDLNEIELSYIFNVLNIPVLQFGGKATGLFHFIDVYGSRMLNTDLVVENFSFNQVDLGKLNLFSEWDDNQQGILLLGTIYKNDTTYTDVNGYIFPVGANEGLDLHFDAKDINIAFLQPFMENIAKNVQGHGFGNVHLYGPFNELSIEGDAYVKEGGLGIEFLDTYYTFSDSIHLHPGSIEANNLHVYDKHKNHGVVDMVVRHQHFKDVEYDVNILAQNMLVYDASEKHNPEIYGTVFGTGSARIWGNEKIVDLDVNMRTDNKTNVSFNFMSGSKAAEYDFITFVDKNAQIEKVDSTLTEPETNMLALYEEESAEIRMNILVEVTPEANITMIMDPLAGDKIVGYGIGNMHIEWGNRRDLRIDGGLSILNGKYNFSLQQLIHRDFTIREGSTVTFRGDPYNANLNIEAIYNVYANINDLDTDLAIETPRTNIQVYCIMHLEGSLENPNITFDIELPGSSEELTQKVKSYINTEDMMTRQILYLLVLNKFYTIDNENRTNEFSAVASSALSYQLSSILNSITDKVQIGTNIRTGQEGFTDTEVEMILSSQLLNNRLIFNGNFGYRNKLEQGNVFVGEFDVEYLLTRSGEVRLKAYNHANDMYRYLNQSLTTQGIGVMYRKDFTHISELFRRRKNLIIPPPGTRLIDPIEAEQEEEEEIPLLQESE